MKFWAQGLATFLILFNTFAYGGGLDVNDVSVLFPTVTSSEPLPNIRLNESGENGPLLAPSILNELVAYATTSFKAHAPESVDSIVRLNDWVITGFRYDPCSPDGCAEELRIVVQPDSGRGLGDSAMHLIYRLSAASPTSASPALRDLVALKEKAAALVVGQKPKQFGTFYSTTSGRPLGIHPVLKLAAALEPSLPARAAVGDLFRKFVLKYAASSRLTQVTFFGFHGEHTNEWWVGPLTDWVFLAGKIEKGHWVPASIANMPAGGDDTFMRVFRRITSGNGGNTITPTPVSSSLNVAELFILDADDIRKNTSRLHTLTQAVHEIENPHLSNRNTVDCLSCHATTAMRVHGELGLAAFVDGKTATIPARITAFADRADVQYNSQFRSFRNFGYYNGQAQISMRTVNESALAAQTINSALKLKGPGRDCSGVQAQALQCFMKPKSGTNPLDANDACLKLCAE